MLNLRPIIQEPPFLRRLLASPRSAWLWLFVRLWLGFYWIDSSLQKLADPAWLSGGDAIRSYWLDALATPVFGRPTFAYNWYQSLVQDLLNAQAESWLGPLVAYGELLAGAALILGAFTGIAAFLGAFIHWNFMLADIAHSNPLFFIAALGLIMSWKVAGYFGLDYFLLHWLSQLRQGS